MCFETVDSKRKEMSYDAWYIIFLGLQKITWDNGIITKSLNYKCERITEWINQIQEWNCILNFSFYRGRTTVFRHCRTYVYVGIFLILMSFRKWVLISFLIKSGPIMSTGNIKFISTGNRWSYSFILVIALWSCHFISVVQM